MALELNRERLIPAQGMSNYGNTCYFNSMLQALLSCSSFTQTVEQEAKNSPDNAVIQALARYIQSSTDANHRAVYDAFIKYAEAHNEGKSIAPMRQNDAHEAFVLMLDCIEKVPELIKLFNHRYEIMIRCHECRIVVSKLQGGFSKCFRVNPGYSVPEKPYSSYKAPTNLHDYISHNVSSLPDYKCPKCGKANTCLKIECLRMIPEIIPVVFTKYGSTREETILPRSLTFGGSNGGSLLEYEMVSVVQHYGNRDGGHYVATCLRREGIRLLNDGSSMPASEFPTDVSCYMAFYHLTKKTAVPRPA